jgi:hypothetical protein
VVNLVLGAWLFLSPWILGFAPQAAVSWNAWISGVVVAGLAVAARHLPSGRSGST